MKNTLKRGIATLLAIIMALSLLPMPAFAAGDNGDGPGLGEEVRENDNSLDQLWDENGEDPDQPEQAQPPYFTKNLESSVTYQQGDAASLSVEAVSDDGGTITYQWYWNTKNSTEGGTPINGARGTSYILDTSNPGTLYFYVVAINTFENGSSASTTSSIAMVAVAASVQAEDPGSTSDSQDTPIVAPITVPDSQDNSVSDAVPGDGAVPATVSDEDETSDKLPDKIGGLTRYDGQKETGNYYIKIPEQLVKLAEVVNSTNKADFNYGDSTFTLLDDIDLSAECCRNDDGNWTPIGSNSTSYTFSGEFDGNGHKIYNLNIKSNGSLSGQGLFGYTGNIYIHDLTVEGSISVGAGSYIGGIVGYTKDTGDGESSKITNCISNVTITAKSSTTVGGVIGYCVGYTKAVEDVTVRNCENQGDLFCKNQGGGIVGYISGSGATLEKCTNKGSIDGEYSIGGICGNIAGSNGFTWTFTECENEGTGTITASANSTIFGTGGILGTFKQQGMLSMESCTNDGDVTGLSNVGGIFGLYLGSGSIGGSTSLKNCTNSEQSTVTGTNNVGGIIGYINIALGKGTVNAVVDSCKNSGAVNGDTNTAGIIGAIPNVIAAASIIKCENSGAIYASSKIAGGIAGQIAATDNTRNIEKCTNSGSVTANGYLAGGIAAELASGNITGCTNSGDVTDAGTTYNSAAGGLAALVTGSVTINGSQNSGLVSGAYHVGGLLGMAGAKPNSVGSTDTESQTQLVLEASTNTGSVTGCTQGSTIGYVGGLVGLLHAGADSSAQVLYCSNQGTVSTTDLVAFPQVGGLFGSLTSGSGGAAEIRYCSNTANVTGGNQVGGLAGRIGPWKDAAGELTFKNCYSSGTVTSNGNISPKDLQMGSAVGVADGTTGSASKVYNVFALDAGISAIGTNNNGADGSAFTLLSDSIMKDSSFLDLLGDAFTASGSGYPVIDTNSAPAKINVQFYGAENAVVRVDDIATYAATVNSGASLSFTVTGKEDTITVTSVSVDGTPLTAAGGTYTLNNIQEDTIVSVVTSGATTTTPEIKGEEVVFQFVDQNGDLISDVTVTVSSTGTDETATYQPDDSGHFHLDDGIYAVTVETSSYAVLSGRFTVSESVAGTTTYSATLYPQNTETSTLTLGLGGKDYYVEILNGDITVAVSKIADESTSSDTIFEPLPVGQYRYKATGAAESSSAWSGKPMGSGPLALTADSQTVKLRFVDFVGPCQGGSTSSLSNPQKMLYKLEITDSTGTAYAPGSTEIYTEDLNGDPRGYAVLPSAPNGMKYYYRFIPNSDQYWGSSGTLYLYDSTKDKRFYGLNLSDDNYFIISPKSTKTITVPANASLRLYRFVKFYEPVEDIDVGTPTMNASAGTKTYTVTVPTDVNRPIFYEVRLDGYIKYVNTFTANGTSAASIVITEANLTPISQGDQADENKDNAQNIITNAPDSKCINLDVGQSFELYCFRALQMVDGGNRYAEPDYQIEIISGSAVRIEETFYAGAIIKGVNEGVSFVRVTYDGTVFQNHLYPSIAEQNVLVLAFVVGQNGTTVIDPGMINQGEFDRNYYIRSVNGVAQADDKGYAECTFTPTVKSGSGTIVGVKIHAPISSTGTWDNNAWESIEANGDGSYTAKLADGRSMIQITASDGSVAFYSLSAYGLDIQIDNVDADKVTQSNGTFNVEVEPGSTIKVSFTGLELPVPKLGAIYNPGYPDKTYLIYTLTGQETNIPLESTHTQYNISTVNDITVNIPNTPGLYELTGGKIHTSSIGEGSGGHRAITRGGENKGIFAGMDSGGNSSESILGYFGTLPDLKFTVTGEDETGDKHTAKFTVPSDIKRIVVLNNQGHRMSGTDEGNVHTYELADNGGGDGATYSYAVERPGYVTITGKFTVGQNAFSLDLQDDSNWTPTGQTGNEKATVSIIGDAFVAVREDSATVTTSPADLFGKSFVSYNHGGYTVLHALLDSLDAAGKSYTCTSGVLTPTNPLPATNPASGTWICSVNNVKVADYANTLVRNGDQIVFYYKTAAQTQRAWFRETEVTAAKDGSVTVTVMSVPVDNTVANQAGTPIQGASIYIDGKNWGAKTGLNGTATLSGLNSLAKGAHTITAQTDTGTLTFARCILTITDTQGGTSSGDTISVTFRLIGDQARGTAAYDQYVNWIGTTTCELPKGSKVGDLFTRVLSANGFTYEGAESNYVKSITIPTSLGGYELSEKKNGLASGWMYTVNGAHPNMGLNDWPLYDGDEVIWHYVNSPTLEGTDANSWVVNPWLYAEDTAPSVPTGSAEVNSVKFGTKTLTRSGTVFTLTLAANETAPTAGSDFIITLADRTATKTDPVKKNDGWEFTVTAPDGTTVTYTITVSVTSEPPTLDTPLISTLRYLANNVTNPAVGSTGGEWAVLAQARGNTLADAAKQAYLTNLWHYADKLNGVLDEYGFSHTEYSRVILALTSIGVDASAVKNGGKTYDFVTPLLDKDCTQVIAQGNNGTTFALIALDSGSYLNNAEGKKARAVWIDSLATEQNADGSWPILSGQAGSIDITAMAVQALAPYYKDASKLSALGTVNTTHAKLKSMVDSAVAWLAKQSGNNYGSCEAAAQMLVAMTALGSQEYADKALESLLTYQIGSTGSFCTKAGGGANQMSTEQAAYALVAYDRFKNSKNSLYNMTDVTLSKADLNITSAQYTITVNSGANGKIEPSSAVVASGANKTFTITPDIGCQIKDVKVDGVSIGAQTSYTFTNVSSNHTITATFAAAANDITVYFTLLGDTAHGDPGTANTHTLSGGGLQTWIPRTEISVPAGSTVGDVFATVLDSNHYYYEGFANNYIKYITTPSGLRLGEFTNGQLSGWMYTVNGEHPNQGLNNWTVYDGDEIIWHYTDDYTKERGGTGSSTGNTSGELNPTVSGGSAYVSSSSFQDAINAALQNRLSEILISPAGASRLDSLSVNLPTDALYEAARSGLGVTVESGAGVVEIPSNALSGIARTAKGGDITIDTTSQSASRGTSLLSSQADLTSDQLANCSVTEVTITSGRTSITSWGGTAITLSLPVDSRYFEARERYTVYQISADGSMETHTGRCVKSGNSLYVEVETTHLSTFIVVPNADGPASDLAAASTSPTASTTLPTVNTRYVILPFMDAANHWALDSIGYVYQHGLMAGTSAVSFQPEVEMSRAMFVTVLHRLEGTPIPSGVMVYSDVELNSWYTDAVAWATAAGIVNGTGVGKFSPNVSITREEMATMMMRYAKYKGYDTAAAADLAGYADSYQINEWAYRAMEWANGTGMITGRTAFTLVPQGTATRAEAATILVRFIQKFAPNMY